MRRRAVGGWVLVLVAAVLGFVAAPASADTPSPWSPAAVVSGTANDVTCPSTSQCTAIDGSGGEVTFNPADPSPTDPVTPLTRTTIDSGYALVRVACPTTTKCTAIDGSGGEVTFNPTNPTDPVTPATRVMIDSGQHLYGVACPSVSLCVAVDDTSDEVEFDPTTGTHHRFTIDSGYNVWRVACLSTTRCTALEDLNGGEVEFNPNGTNVSRFAIETGGSEGVSCPTTSQCTAIDLSGAEVTFDPTTGSHSVVTIDNAWLLGVSCPTTSQCTAVDLSGREVTFNPTNPGTPTVITIDSDPLTGVACPDVSECVAIDAAGGVYVASGPTIAGTPEVGHVLRESHATWSGSPASYSYQWEDCDTSGANCTAITGATNQTYTLTANDVGDTIRVQETATNASGSSFPNSSAATTKVLPVVTLTVTPAGAGSGTVTSIPAGIYCGSGCSYDFAKGTTITLTATPASGSTFTGWTGGGCTGTGTCKITLTAATTITATFQHEVVPQNPTNVQLAVSRRGSGHGKVTSSPAGISCGSTCKHEFASGSVITLTAKASFGSKFTGWTGGGCKGTSTCKVKLTAATSVTASFKLLVPNTKITSAHINRRRHLATFRFKAVRAKAKGFKCALVKIVNGHHHKPRYRRCTHHRKTYRRLSRGRHIFYVRAYNKAGTDHTPARKRFRI